MRQLLLLSVFTASLLSIPTGTALPRSDRSTPIPNESNGLVERNEDCHTVVNNIVVNPSNNGTQGPAGEVGPIGPAGPAGPQGPQGNSGTTYIRWGRTVCPDTDGTVLVYEGVAVGSKWNEGGGVDYLCLPEHPEFLRVTPGQQTHRTKLYGVEYEMVSPPTGTVFANRHNHNAPCAVCYTPARGTKLMIPAKVNCPSSWTREYYGYLMSQSATYNHRYRFACVDVNAESVPGSAAGTVESVFYFTETTCNGIHCPPYEDGKEIACVICTK